MSTPSRAALALGALLLATVAAARASDPPSGCLVCHADPTLVADEALRRPVSLFSEDVHLAHGFSCHDCHGGDPSVEAGSERAVERAHSVEHGYRGAPGREEQPAFCARCHSAPETMAAHPGSLRTDQEALFSASIHGLALADGIEAAPSCLDCHGRREPGDDTARAHSLRSSLEPESPVHPLRMADTCGRCHADDAVMEEFGLNTAVVADWRGGVHHQAMLAGDLSAPTCNDCHGNHGDTPSGVADLLLVCGSCHVQERQHFERSKMSPAFLADGLGQCTVCHAEHRVLPPSTEMLMSAMAGEVLGGGACLKCHVEPDDPARAVSTTIKAELLRLDGHVQASHGALDEAREAAMPIRRAVEAVEAAEALADEARSTLHCFEASPIQEICEKGCVEAEGAARLATDALAEHAFRGRWLLGVLGLLALAVTLVLWKIRRLEAPSKN